MVYQPICISNLTTILPGSFIFAAKAVLDEVDAHVNDRAAKFGSADLKSKPLVLYRANWTQQFRALFWRSWHSVKKEPRFAQIKIFEALVSHWQIWISAIPTVYLTLLFFAGTVPCGSCGNFLLGPEVRSRRHPEHRWRHVLGVPEPVLLDIH